MGGGHDPDRSGAGWAALRVGSMSPAHDPDGHGAVLLSPRHDPDGAAHEAVTPEPVTPGAPIGP